MKSQIARIRRSQTDADQAWVARHHPGPALLVRVDQLTGVTGADLNAITGWLHGN